MILILLIITSMVSGLAGLFLQYTNEPALKKTTTEAVETLFNISIVCFIIAGVIAVIDMFIL